MQDARDRFCHKNYCADFLFTVAPRIRSAEIKLSVFYLIFHGADLSGSPRTGTKSNSLQFPVSKARHDMIVEHAN